MSAGIDWVKLARRLQEAQAQLVHHEDGFRRYGDEFYAEALRRAFGYKEPHGHVKHETVSESTGLMTTAYANHLIESNTIMSRLNAESAQREAKAAREETRRVYREAGRDLARLIRDRCNERTVPSRFRREGVLTAADWIDPEAGA